ncbi:MAG: hypothetical protein IPM84_25920 [Anaerolineae bacterium]|nr:hypothetical protein [Anaerolineae bacterium]
MLERAPDNQIGGTMPADRNLISSNPSAGIIITGAGSDRNIIIGNSIGPSAAVASCPMVRSSRLACGLATARRRIALA